MADQPNVNPSPKQLFLSDSSTCRSHMDLIGRPDLRWSVDVAKAQYVWRLAHMPSEEPNAAFHKLVGMQEFLDIFFNLAIAPQPVSMKPTGQLNHTA